MEQGTILDVRSEGSVAVVVFQATAISDSEGINSASAQVQQYIDENDPKAVVFDFGQVKFFSSQVLGLLLQIRAGLKKRGGEVVISGIDPQLHRIFKITNLDQLFKFFGDSQGAVKAVGAD